MRYLDTTVFVYGAIYEGPKATKAREMLADSIEAGSVVTSCLTIDEFVRAVWKLSGNRAEAIERGSTLFEFSNLRISPVTRNDSYRALSLMKKYPHLKPRDATHISVAIRLGAGAIVSDDKDFDGLKEIKREGLD